MTMDCLKILNNFLCQEAREDPDPEPQPGLEQHELSAGQRVENAWLDRVRQWYPDRHSRTYLLPSLHFNRVAYDVIRVAGQQLLMLRQAPEIGEHRYLCLRSIPDVAYQHVVPQQAVDTGGNCCHSHGQVLRQALDTGGKCCCCHVGVPQQAVDTGGHCHRRNGQAPQQAVVTGGHCHCRNGQVPQQAVDTGGHCHRRNGQAAQQAVDTGGHCPQRHAIPEVAGQQVVVRLLDAELCCMCRSCHKLVPHVADERNLEPPLPRIMACGCPRRGRRRSITYPTEPPPPLHVAHLWSLLPDVPFQLPWIYKSDSNDDATTERVLRCLRLLGEHQREAMMVLSKFEIYSYLRDSADCKQLLAGLDDLCLGGIDLLLIHRLYGLVIGGIRSIRATQRSEQLLLNRISRVVSKLNMEQGILTQLLSDLPSVRVTKVVILPNTSSRCVLQALSTDPSTSQVSDQDITGLLCNAGLNFLEKSRISSAIHAAK